MKAFILFIIIYRKILNHKHKEGETCYDLPLFEELQSIFTELMHDYDDHMYGEYNTCDFSPHTEIGK